MAVFKCKMRGSTIEFEQGDTVGLALHSANKEAYADINYKL